MTYLGDFLSGCTIRHAFTTRRFSSGAPFTLAGTPNLLVRRDVGAQDHSCAALSLSVDCMGRTGLNTWEIRTGAAQSFYDCGHDFTVEINAGTVDSVSVVGEVVATFSLMNRFGLRPAAHGCTSIQLNASGQVVTNPCSTIHSVQSVLNTVIGVSGNVTGSVASVTGAVGSVTGAVGSVTAVGAGAIAAGDIASAALNEIADAVLDRVMSTGTDSGGDNTTARTVRQALRSMRNKVNANLGIVYKEDDSTTSHTFTISSGVSCEPINVIDPT